jgi:hypothetical protein
MACSRPVLLCLGFLTLAACEILPPTPNPDYVIRVTPAGKESVATPPPCPGWDDAVANPLDNKPIPQFGCATSRNLASMVDNPNDLVEGRTMGPSRGVLSVGSIRRYDNNQARGLIMPVSETSQAASSTAASTTSPMTGDVTEGRASSSPGASTPAP